MSADYWETFRAILGQIAHEDDLLASRTLWLVVSQCLLILAYFSIDKARLPDRPQHDHHRLVGLLGIFATAFIYAAILAGVLDFVALRTTIGTLTAAHPNLPLRPLPDIGIGSGLLCPILLCLLLLYFWVMITARSRLAATLMLLSGALFAVFSVGEGHRLAGSDVAQTLIDATCLIAIALLVVAIAVAMRAMRGPAGT